jgi:hypothetical protein
VSRRWRWTIWVAAALLLAGGAAAIRSARFQRVVARFPQPAPADSLRVAGQAWRCLHHWEFRRGRGRDAWGWGEWRLDAGALEGRGRGGQDAVYFLPFEHGEDFLLETNLCFLSGEDGRVAEAQLITRDSAQMNNESGVTLFAEGGRFNVRHMVGRREHLLRIVPLAAEVGYGGWHRLQLAVRDGRATVLLDGQVVYAGEEELPPGYYREPHLAVKSGLVRFLDLKIFVPS